MKKFALLLGILLLVGCASMSSTYDAIVFERLIDLSVQTDNANQDCSSRLLEATDADKLYSTTLFLAKYTQYKSTDFNPAIVIINNNYKQFRDAYAQQSPPSETYCHLKLKLLNVAVDNVIVAERNKPQNELQ